MERALELLSGIVDANALLRIRAREWRRKKKIEGNMGVCQANDTE